ncbi:MAG: DUF177 domain-containing protein [Pseudomonadota bacterium]
MRMNTVPITHTKLVPIKVSKLSPKASFPFDLQPTGADLATLQEDLGLLSLRKLRLSGEIAASGSTDWALNAKIGATVVQPCVVTLEPVTTRIDEPVSRLYVKRWPSEEDLGEEVEMPEDDSLERLGEEIDVYAVLQEALALALPVYPRSGDAEVEGLEARPEGARAITSIDDDAFSALSDLKKKLEDGK